MDDNILSQWFDLTKRIYKDEKEEAIAQIEWCAFKDRIPRAEISRQIAESYAAIRRHNAKFPVK